jgi:hypothetical protein
MRQIVIMGTLPRQEPKMWVNLRPHRPHRLQNKTTSNKNDELAAGHRGRWANGAAAQCGRSDRPHEPPPSDATVRIGEPLIH